MQFAFATASQILFGRGVIEQVGKIAAGFGHRALVVSGSSGRNLNRLEAYLSEAGVLMAPFTIHGEPSVDHIRAGVTFALETGCDVVIGFGGGSAVDAAKAITAMLTNPGDMLDYLEVVGRGESIRMQPAPFLAVPTTAGTGSEVTRNAVLSVPEQRVKVSLRSPMMLARAALVDPELTYSLPAEVTASTGMDALAQVIEPFVSRRANPMADLYCREGILRASRSLVRAFENGEDAAAREEMSFASLMGGLALANAGLGAVHGFAGPVGGMLDAPHGAVCAALLPPVVAANARALAVREPHNPALERYHEVARLVTGHPDAAVPDLVRWLEGLRRALRIPGLRSYGMQPGDLEVLVQKSAVASSMKANPVQLTNDELRSILEEAL